MHEPAIRGAGMINIVRDLTAYRDAGRIAPEELESALPLAARKLLDDGIVPMDWYPMEIYARITELLVRLEGGDGPVYQRRRGRRAGARFAGSEYFPSLARLRDLRVASLDELAAAVRFVTNLYVEFFSKGSWVVSRDRDRSDTVRIDVRQAEAYPENLRHAVEGFLEGALAHVAPGVRCSSERLAPGHIAIRVACVLEG